MFSGTVRKSLIDQLKESLPHPHPDFLMLNVISKAKIKQQTFVWQDEIFFSLMV